ncbi:uncharacterized protein LOC122565704 isoform X1 [Bombus pyrosoma]|uniref:uncharacterized protein LOC122565704 isoform X1 n=1 Tax=Bombus pyrosoma TaxID=396416 RepID=UPI001CB980CA|nr:uncharacterized protein LOC122565704 isoform X1 [Bombus pyrosoma]
MSEFFMEQPETAETNVVREDVHQRVPNNYRLRVAQQRKAGYESPKGAQHLHETVISQANVIVTSRVYLQEGGSAYERSAGDLKKSSSAKKLDILGSRRKITVGI